MSFGGALAAPSTAFIYELSMMSLGLELWLEELESYRKYPPMQAPSSYNLDAVIRAVQEAHSRHPSD
jgi:arylsulfatase